MDNFISKKEALIKAIEEEKKRLEQELEKENEELSFLTKIWDTTETDYLKIVASTDVIDMLCAMILSDEKRNDTLPEIKALLEANRHLHEQLDSRETRNLIFAFADLETHHLYDLLKEVATPGYKKSFVDKSGLMGVKLVLKLSGVRKINLYPFMQARDLYPNYLDALLAIKTVKQHVKVKNNMRDPIDKSTRRLLEQMGLKEEDAKKDFDMSTTKRIIFQARNYYDQLKQKSLSKKRTYRRELVAYETLEENLDKLFKAGEITNTSDLLFRISNPTIRVELLKLIYLHNQKIYDDLSSEYNKLSTDPSKVYQSILDKYGISPENYQVSDISFNSPEELTQILQILKELEINNESTILEIIKNGDLETIQTVFLQVIKGYIGTELLKNNLGLFSKETTEYKNFVSNLEYFIEEGINPHYLRVEQELFLSSPTTIKTNIQTLKEYELLSSMKTGSSCHFLTNESLSTGIDMLLELGFENFLLDDLSILNYQSNFKRLYLLKALNIPVESVAELKEVLASEKFFVSDDTIDSYLYTANHKKQEQLNSEIIPSEYLSEYPSTTRTCNINGVLISKNKIKRKVQNLDESISSANFLAILTTNSILSDEEFSTLKSSLANQSSEKVYIKTE